MSHVAARTLNKLKGKTLKGTCVTFSRCTESLSLAPVSALCDIKKQISSNVIWAPVINGKFKCSVLFFVKW